MSEIVKLKDGSYVMLNTENCEWLLGFVAGDKVWFDLKGVPFSVQGKILDVIYDAEAQEHAISLQFFNTGCRMLIRASDVENMGEVFD